MRGRGRAERSSGRAQHDLLTSRSAFSTRRIRMKRGLIPGGSAVVMGLIISLAFLGVGYGLWSDTLRISGAVATGSVNAAFSLHELDEGLARGVSGGPTDNDQNEDL